MGTVVEKPLYKCMLPHGVSRFILSPIDRQYRVSIDNVYYNNFSSRLLRFKLYRWFCTTNATFVHTPLVFQPKFGDVPRIYIDK